MDWLLGRKRAGENGPLPVDRLDLEASAVLPDDPLSDAETEPGSLFPHAPYDPPAPFETRFGTGPPERRLGTKGWLEPGVRYPSEVLERNVAHYDGEIAWTDEWVGRLVAAAEALPGGPPLIVVAGDHGESLGDLEEKFAYAFAHGEFLYDHQTRIPLVFRWKGKLPEGRVVADLFAAVDLAPTILDLIGEDDPLGCEGLSRAALVRGDGGAGAEEVVVGRLRGGREALVELDELDDAKLPREPFG